MADTITIDAETLASLKMALRISTNAFDAELVQLAGTFTSPACADRE